MRMIIPRFLPMMLASSAMRIATTLDTGKFLMNNKCGFSKAWQGTCSNDSPCQEHNSLLCVSCKQPATHECSETGQLVCGATLCDECEHAIAPDGSNGGVGFFSTIPKDMQANWKTHVRRTDQKFKPWFERE